MTRLEGVIEARTAELIADARGEPVQASVLAPTPA